MTAGRHMAMMLGTVLGLTACAAPAQPPPRRRLPPPATRAPTATATCASSATTICRGASRWSSRRRSDAANGNWVYVGHTPERSQRSAGLGRRPGQRPADPQSPHREDGVERHVDRRDLGPGAAATRLAHPQRPGARQLTLGLGGLRLRLRLRADGTRLPDSQLRHRQGRSSSRSTTSPRATPIRRRSRSSPRSPARRPATADRGAAARSSAAPTRATGRSARACFYSSSGEPGFRGLTVIHIWDLKDPRRPKFVGRAASPSQREGAAGLPGRVRAPSDRGRAEQPALHRVPRGRARGRLGHLEPGRRRSWCG